jgi:hypothetical protein
MCIIALQMVYAKTCALVFIADGHGIRLKSTASHHSPEETTIGSMCTRRFGKGVGG